MKVASGAVVYFCFLVQLPLMKRLAIKDRTDIDFLNRLLKRKSEKLPEGKTRPGDLIRVFDAMGRDLRATAAGKIDAAAMRVLGLLLAPAELVAVCALLPGMAMPVWEGVLQQIDALAVCALLPGMAMPVWEGVLQQIDALYAPQGLVRLNPEVWAKTLVENLLCESAAEFYGRAYQHSGCSVVTASAKRSVFQNKYFLTDEYLEKSVSSMFAKWHEARFGEKFKQAKAEIDTYEKSVKELEKDHLKAKAKKALESEAKKAALTVSCNRSHGLITKAEQEALTPEQLALDISLKRKQFPSAAAAGIFSRCPPCQRSQW
jgi:hypothetical protein